MKHLIIIRSFNPTFDSLASGAPENPAHLGNELAKTMRRHSAKTMTILSPSDPECWQIASTIRRIAPYSRIHYCKENCGVLEEGVKDFGAAPAWLRGESGKCEIIATQNASALANAFCVLSFFKKLNIRAFRRRCFLSSPPVLRPPPLRS